MTLHRFAHFGDLHLGPNSRNADRRRALDQGIAEQDRDGLAAWLLPGDLNHGRMTIDDRNWLVDRVQRMANRAPVVILYGNHDLPGDLDVFAQLLGVYPIVVIDTPVTFSFRTATRADVTLFALPYPSKAGLVAAGTPHELIPEVARQALDAIFLDASLKLEEARQRGEIAMMLGHINVGGSIVSSGQPNIGKEIEIDQALLDRLGPIYKGLNHIHHGQRIANAFYAGSMCRLDWGETELKFYNELTYRPEADVILSTPVTGCDGRWAYHVEARTLDVAPMYHVDGELSPSGFKWRIKGCACAGWCSESRDICRDGGLDWSGCEVRVRYTFNAAEKSALDESLVKAPFAGATRIDDEPIPVRTRALRAPEVAAAQSLDAKVAAFVRSAGLSWGPSLETKFAALQGPDGAAFLTQVQRELQPRGVAEVA
jgi:hypothetical protein